MFGGESCGPYSFFAASSILYIWFRPSVLSAEYFATGDALASKIWYICLTPDKFIVFIIISKWRNILKISMLGWELNLSTLSECQGVPVAKYLVDSTDGRNHTQNSRTGNTLLRLRSSPFFHHRLLLSKPHPQLSYRFCPSFTSPISTTYRLFLNTPFQTFLIPSSISLSSKWHAFVSSSS